jgi:predicted thioesterase
VASFQGEVVHQVCSTFTLAREIEWATRQYVLAMRDSNEEGVGTFISIDHKNPAFVGEEVRIESKIDTITGNELICSYTAFVNDRVVATGKTGQKILTREKLDTIFSKQ